MATVSYGPQISVVATSPEDPYTSIAYDPDGEAHIAWYDKENGKIMHTWHSGSTWTTEPVGPTAGTRSISIAIAPTGEPWISYGDGLHFGNLILAQKGAKTWNTAIVDTGGYPKTGAFLGAEIGGAVGAASSALICIETGPGMVACGIVGGVIGADAGGYEGYYAGRAIGDVGQYSSLAFDQRGVPHIAYTGGEFHDTMLYSSLDPKTGEWEIVTVDGATGVSPSLRLDVAGNPHIAYQTSTVFPSLMYAISGNGGKIWSTTKVDNGGITGRTGYSPSLALDSRGYPHIAYVDASVGDLRYSSWNGKTWKSETIEHYARADPDSSVSLVIDHEDTPFILYNAIYPGESNPFMFFATKKPQSEWRVVVIFDTEGHTGMYPSLTLNPEGIPSETYYLIDNHSLKFAYEEDITA